jgi:hypothetical protein
VNWDAISAIGQLAGAIAVVVTVGYLAVQIRIARLAASDANRLQRGAGVREMIFNVLNNEQLRRATEKSERYGDTIRLVAQHLELSEDEGSLAKWACMAWWWIHWTQWASIKTQRDEEELRNLVSLFYRSRTMSVVWNLHPGVGLLEPDFRKFVNAALEAKPD